MQSPPRYVRTEAELAAAKLWRCPHCQAVGQVNRHGALRGASEDGATKTGARGQRFLCSKRGRRRGCGHTFSVLWATVLKFATVRTATLWRFYAARLRGDSVLAAWLNGRGGFALETAYGWWRRWQRIQPALRTRLCANRDPPAKAVAEQLAARYGAADPIAGWQLAEQRPWP